MSRKMRLFLLLLSFSLLAVVCTGCGKNEEEVKNESVDEENNKQIDVEGNMVKPLDVILGDEGDVLVMDAGQSFESAAQSLLPTYIYYSSRDFSHLMMEEEDLPQKTPETILSALARHNIVTLDTNANSFSVVVTEEGKVRVVLDLNRKFRKYLQTMAEQSETVILASLTNTFLNNYDADEMVLTVDGSTLKTSHNTYKEPLNWYSLKVERIDGENE